jgi:hypothetical protein
MVRVFLQDMADDIRIDALPSSWTSFDLESFSLSKKLWDYQQEAVENALKVLWKYYEDIADYRPNERRETNLDRKRMLLQWYRDNEMTEDLDIRLNRANGGIARLLEDHYMAEGDKIPYEHFINRMGFWMATGSGKSLVIIKLIQALWQLVRRGEIPPNDILVLTHREDLLEQLRRFVDEFNSTRSDFAIVLKELKEYPVAKRENASLFGGRGVTVFYYRSDNLSDEQKEKIIDFRGYDNDGGWYVLLDEAHKGDREESKRQQIYSILSRNGFLFNFSATFVDPRDFVTTVFNFNLSEFIRAGYGKHISILRQEMRAFGKDDDYNGDEKQKVVLKSLMMLAYARKFSERVARAAPGTSLYHRPLLLTLVNSVNTEDADLKLFFRELERIGRGKIGGDIWRRAKDELWNELKERPVFMFEDDGIEIDRDSFRNLDMKDILRWVYNSSGQGGIEILVRPSNRQELAFKLKTGDRPFALIKIGDVSGWLKDELAGYEVNERFDDESYFERLNWDDSDINILMGSRAFYEGWDSNRPNVINFINIGVGTDARKFVLQSVGRGVRIEPLGDMRKRLIPLHNAGEVKESLFHRIKDDVMPLETLFIFGTNRGALQMVIEHLDQERKEKGHRLSLSVNEAAAGRTLLIPTYRDADRPLMKQRPMAKFEVTRDEFGLLKRYVGFLRDDRVLLALYDAEPDEIGSLRKSLSNPGDYYRWNERSFKDIDMLVGQIFRYFGITPKEFEKLKKLDEEIRHFKNIQVLLKDIGELQRKVETVRRYRDTSAAEKELDEKYKRSQITLERYKDGIKRIAQQPKEETVEYEGKRLHIKRIANHYYVPIILSEDEKVHYIKHIIKTESEVRFVNELERYLEGNNKFEEFDWWMFSKLDESLDDVYIPYYDPKTNGIRHFKPDFIFWLQKGRNYFIVFIDPKSASFTDYQHKVLGHKGLFEGGDGTKIIRHEKFNVRVFAFLYTDDVNQVAEGGYKKYWFDEIDKVLDRVLGHSRGKVKS